MAKYNKEELEVIKNHIRENCCGSWYKLHNLGRLIFEEVYINSTYFLKIKNKYFWINYDDYKDLETFVFYINIENMNKSNFKGHIKEFKLNWFINILVKNDKVVDYIFTHL